jgi:uncharacterized membrane protein YphA (DoxX/SURF4 family)
MSALKDHSRPARVARLTLGAVWLYQGIVPKWIAQVPFELDIVARSGLYLISPEWMIAAIGVLETGLGIWIVSGYRPRPAVMLATGCMLVLQTLVLWVEPSLLLGPFGGIVKNAGLVALAWIVWVQGTRVDVNAG